MLKAISFVAIQLLISSFGEIIYEKVSISRSENVSIEEALVSKHFFFIEASSLPLKNVDVRVYSIPFNIKSLEGSLVGDKQCTKRLPLHDSSCISFVSCIYSLEF
jgi:hypothetical protein